MNPADSPFRQALTELIRAAGLVRRIGVNLNQAVAKLNATGQRSADLLPYAVESMRRAERLDAAAESAVIGKVLRGRSVAGLLYYLFGPGGAKSTPTHTWWPDGGTRLTWSRRCARTAAGTSVG